MPSKSTTIAAPSDDAIRTRAYLLWEADGRPFGRDDHYWGLALSETIAAVPAKPKRAAASAKPVEKKAKAKPAKAAKAKAPVGKSKKSKA
jgi:hypothetical protein